MQGARRVMSDPDLTQAAELARQQLAERGEKLTSTLQSAANLEFGSKDFAVNLKKLLEQKGLNLSATGKPKEKKKSGAGKFKAGIRALKDKLTGSATEETSTEEQTTLTPTFQASVVSPRYVARPLAVSFSEGLPHSNSKSVSIPKPPATSSPASPKAKSKAGDIGTAGHKLRRSLSVAIDKVKSLGESTEDEKKHALSPLERTAQQAAQLQSQSAFFQTSSTKDHTYDHDLPPPPPTLGRKIAQESLRELKKLQEEEEKKKEAESEAAAYAAHHAATSTPQPGATLSEVELPVPDELKKLVANLAQNALATMPPTAPAQTQALIGAVSHLNQTLIDDKSSVEIRAAINNVTKVAPPSFWQTKAGARFGMGLWILLGVTIGAIAGFALGGLIGGLLGAWSGPGTMFSALGSGFAGAKIGAELVFIFAVGGFGALGLYSGAAVGAHRLYNKQLPPLKFFTCLKTVKKESLPHASATARP